MLFILIISILINCLLCRTLHLLLLLALSYRRFPCLLFRLLLLGLSNFSLFCPSSLLKTLLLDFLSIFFWNLQDRIVDIVHFLYRFHFELVWHVSIVTWWFLIVRRLLWLIRFFCSVRLSCFRITFHNLLVRGGWLEIGWLFGILLIFDGLFLMLIIDVLLLLGFLKVLGLNLIGFLQRVIVVSLVALWVYSSLQVVLSFMSFLNDLFTWVLCGSSLNANSLILSLVGFLV